MDENMMDDAISRGFDPSEDYTPRPMSVRKYRSWCRHNNIIPDPDFGVYTDTPPF